MIISRNFCADKDGPRLLVMGAIHGDETCGPQAINAVISKIDTNEIHLERGSVIFIPVANPEAYKRGVRYVDSNLNRDVVRTENPQRYEQKLANELIGFLDQCDVLLDIHSYHAGGKPFAVINDSAQRYLNFASCLNASWVISGWTKAYLANAPKDQVRSPTEHIGTTEYVYNRGAIDVTLECGQHLDPESPKVAYEGIIRALEYLGITGKSGLPPAQTPQIADMDSVFYSDGDGQFVKTCKHLDFIPAGATVAKRKNQTSIVAEKDGVIIMPRPDAPRGDEWFYLGYLKNAASLSASHL